MNDRTISCLAESALCGSLAIVLLLLTRPIVRRWLGARAVHLLWGVVLVRLLIPWTPHTPLAMLPARMQVEAAPVSMTVRSFVIEARAEQITASSTAIPEGLRGRRSPTFSARIARSAALIWILGAAGVFSLSLGASFRAAMLVRRARKIAADGPAMRALASLPISVRRLRILETHDLKSPALCGWLRPKILLPLGWGDNLALEELRCVLLHEIGHHRRGDVLWRWAFLAARAIHWFNPLVWLAEREMRGDQEMACDEWVLAQAASIDSQKYGEVLLRACKNLAAPRVHAPGHATMAESSAGLAQRIRHLTRARPRGWGAVAGTAVLSAALCGLGPAAGDAQNPPQVLDDSPGSATPSPAPASGPSLATPQNPAAGAKADSKPEGTPLTSAATPFPAAKAKQPQIWIQARFVECPRELPNDVPQMLPGNLAGDDAAGVESILEDPQYQTALRALSRVKGVDLLSPPQVTTLPGQKAVVEIVREFRYATEYTVENDGSGRVTPTAFETRNLGITLEVIPSLRAGGHIDMALTPSVVEFAGFVNYTAGKPRIRTLKPDAAALAELTKNASARHLIHQPIFDVRKIITTASIHSGQTVVLGGISRTDIPIRTDVLEGEHAGKLGRTAKTSEEKLKTYLLIFVSARILNPETLAPATKSPDPAPPL